MEGLYLREQAMEMAMTMLVDDDGGDDGGGASSRTCVPP